MHFDFTLNVQAMINFGLLLIGLWRIEGWGRKFLVEHEILIRDYCKRENITVKDLPTRSGGIRG